MSQVPTPAVTQEIAALYSRQSWAIDSGDAEAWADTFTEDGTFSSPSYPEAATGREQLIRYGRGVTADAEARGHHLQHWVSGLSLTGATQDEVTGRAYLSLVAVVPGEPPRALRNVWLTDRLVRTKGGWRFARRDVSLIPTSPVTGSLKA